MATNEIHVGDTGTIFRLTVKDEDEAVVDISEASSLQIHFERPDLAVLTKTATFTTDGTDGQMQYSTLAGDLSQPGNWRWQGEVTGTGGGWSGHTDILKFKVKPNLD